MWRYRSCSGPSRGEERGKSASTRVIYTSFDAGRILDLGPICTGPLSSMDKMDNKKNYAIEKKENS
jgi:hypothetical protein